MIDYLLQYIAPYPCSECGILGLPLCDNCKYNIIYDASEMCLQCARPSTLGICVNHDLPYSRAWYVGERSDSLERLINTYKFQRSKAVAATLAELLHERIPQLPNNIMVVPVPTISQHIRQRGYDHTLLMVKKLAKKRNVSYKRLLARKTNTKQIGATRSVRIRQAREAFRATRQLDDSVTYLLIDDVYTTGATIQYAAQTLKDAGAGDVWVAVIAHQPSTNDE